LLLTKKFRYWQRISVFLYQLADCSNVAESSVVCQVSCLQCHRNHRTWDQFQLQQIAHADKLIHFKLQIMFGVKKMGNHHQFHTVLPLTLCLRKKTGDYIFCNNLNNKCPITIIFGTFISETIRHRKMVSFNFGGQDIFDWICV